MTTKGNVKNKYGILADLERCVGCYACEVACKQENRTSRGTPWIRVHTVGPELVDGKLRMEYIPLILDRCTFCRNRDMDPSCVAHCPTKALSIFNTNSILDALRSDRRYQVCTIKTW